MNESCDEPSRRDSIIDQAIYQAILDSPNGIDTLPITRRGGGGGGGGLTRGHSSGMPRAQSRGGGLTRGHSAGGAGGGLMRARSASTRPRSPLARHNGNETP